MTRRWRAAGAAALCVALLAGCSTDLAVAPDTRLGFHLAQIESDPVAEQRVLRVERVSTSPRNGYDWTVASVDPGSAEVTVQYTDGACTTADRVRIEETATTVVLGITASKPFHGSCIAVGIPRSTTVALRKPLGGRALMEGATGTNDGLPTVTDPEALPRPACSTERGSASDVPVGMPDAGARMAPTAVTAAFVCRTWWPKGSARTASVTITDRAAVAALASRIDAGSTGLRPGAPATCSKRLQGSQYAVTLQGAGVRVEVRADEIGCGTITNGAVSGTMTPALAHALDALFPG